MSNIPYTVNSWDVCSAGNERLRNQTEFMIVTPVGPGTDLADARRGLKADIQSHMQPDWFDYAACKAAIDAWCDTVLAPRMNDAKANPFADLDFDREDEESDAALFLYVQAPCNVPVY